MNAVSSATRTDVRFDSNGDECGAWFYRPDGPGPFPVVVLCHGLGATREMGFDPYARAFADAGIAALAFTYRSFGDSDGEPRQVLDIGRQREDIASAIEYVKGLDDVDPDRVALFGSSFGGGHVIAVAADRDDIAAVVAQCPFTDGQASGLTLGVSSTVKIGAYAVADGLARLIGRKPVYARLAGERGEPAMMTAPDVIVGYKALMPEGFEEDNRVAGRIGLDVLFERPGRRMKELNCPTLVCACEKDTVAPYGPTKKFAEAARNVELKSYPFGHFDIYLGEGFDRASADQVAFFKRVLKP
ncbi:MAG: alpha/beta fold hydrolase [Thermoleophilaceae bacterium]|nr:alpha/beta fold hydrolase [Thermoleophilaceae bacterium]